MIRFLILSSFLVLSSALAVPVKVGVYSINGVAQEYVTERTLAADDTGFTPAPTTMVSTFVDAALKEIWALLIDHDTRHLPNGADPLATAAGSALSTSSTSTTGTANSFSRSDHTHSISVINYEVGSAVDTTTTRTTDVLMNAMSISPVTGTYLVSFSTSLESSSASGTVRVSIYVGGTLQANSTRRSRPTSPVAGLLTGDATGTEPIATSEIVTVTSGQAIELRWRMSNGTATAHERNMTAIKLSN